MPPGDKLQLVEQADFCKKDDAAGHSGGKHTSRMLCKGEQPLQPCHADKAILLQQLASPAPPCKPGRVQLGD
jgi:hypothetical protein